MARARARARARVRVAPLAGRLRLLARRMLICCSIDPNLGQVLRRLTFRAVRVLGGRRPGVRVRIRVRYGQSWGWGWGWG
jgi:hypothetical protein